MQLKTFFNLIDIKQKLLMSISVLMLIVLPLVLAFQPDIITPGFYDLLFTLSLLAVSFVMIIRPLSDLWKNIYIKSLVILRKGYGVFSASIIVSILLSKLITSGLGYFQNILTVEYWSLNDYAIFAHLGDLTGLILLITSNNLSKKILKSWWKKIQKLSYVYFYAGAIYHAHFQGQTVLAITLMIFVTILLLSAWYKKNKDKYAETKPAEQQI